MLLELPDKKKAYFASDFHLGAPTPLQSREREIHILRWLNQIEPDAHHIFLVGDLFDFWFEYKRVIPKGYTRLLGKLAELSDKGIGISVFIGNHDMWMDGYFESELHIPVYTAPIEVTINDSLFMIGHGDGLGPGDHGYKLIKKIFRSPFSRWLFASLHPSWGIALADYLSKSSRVTTSMEQFLGEDKEWLFQFCQSEQQIKYRDYYVFGHRHLPLDLLLQDGGRYINLGDWIHYYTYAEFDGRQLQLLKFPKD